MFKLNNGLLMRNNSGIVGNHYNRIDPIVSEKKTDECLEPEKKENVNKESIGFDKNGTLRNLNINNKGLTIELKQNISSLKIVDPNAEPTKLVGERKKRNISFCY